MSRSTADRILVWTVHGAGILAGGILVLILAFLALEAFPSIQARGLARFFRDGAWRPAEDLLDLTPMLVGTLLVAGGALLLAVPLGVLCAIFCHFYAPPGLARAFRQLLGVMAGIPSVVYGFWGLVVLVPILLRFRPPGSSLLAGILVLGLMLIPMVALTAHAALASLPRTQLRAAAALGLSRWGTIRGVALPGARSGILAGVVLASGRALGETMAVLMVTGNVVQLPGGLLEPVRVLTANIALEMSYALEGHRAALFLSGLLLTAVVALLVLAVGRLEPSAAELR